MQLETVLLTSDTLLVSLLIVHGIIGGTDTLLNHELIARLPHRVDARTEIGIHVLREAIYGALFGGLAWFAWHGAWAAPIGALLAAALLIDVADEFIENRTRVLPQNERVLHFMLTLNLGLITAVLTMKLFSWSSQPSELIPANYRLLSWVLSALALASGGWSIRDFVAWRALGRVRK